MADNSLESMQSNLNIIARDLNEHDLVMHRLVNDLLPKLIDFYQQDTKKAGHILLRMKMLVNELESLIETFSKHQQHERNLDLKVDSEKDKFVREKVDLAGTEIINEQSASHKTKTVHYKSVTNEVSEQLSLRKLSLKKTKRFWSGSKTITHDKNNFFKYDTDKNPHLLGSSMHIQKQLVPNASVSERRSSKESETSSVILESHRSLSSESKEKKVSVNSCSLEDTVLVIWDFTYKNYMVYQENSKHLVFLHPDSLDNVMLKNNSGGTPKVIHFSAEILQKEYCCARKEPNRYNAEKGMKFFRVKIRPVKIPSYQCLSISKNVFD